MMNFMFTCFFGIIIDVIHTFSISSHDNIP